MAFSLSEVLKSLPEDHPDRIGLLAFYNKLCSEYLKLQGSNGLWRQVLTKPEPFIRSALLGLQGITSQAIDRTGNVYGFCSDSRYSFTPDNYKYELRTVTNDNHGIGIMLLVGCETILMEDWLRQPE